MTERHGYMHDGNHEGLKMMRFSMAVLLAFAMLCSTGCSQIISTQYQKGKFVKEVEKPGVAEIGRRTVLGLSSPTSVRVYDEVEHGHVTEKNFEKIRVDNRGRVSLGAAILREVLWRPFSLLLLPMELLADRPPDFFAFGVLDCRNVNPPPKTSDCSFWTTTDVVSNEYMTEASSSNVTTTREPVSTGTVHATVSGSTEDLALDSAGTASLDLSKSYDRLRGGKELSVQYEYKGMTQTATLTRQAVEKGLAARKPPQLVIAASEITYEGGLKSGTLSGDDQGELQVKIANTDKEGAGWGVKLVVSGNPCRDVTVGNELSVGDVRPGETKTVRVPISAGLDAESCALNLTLQAREDFGQDSRKVIIPPISIKAVDRPDLYIASISHTGTAQNDDSVELTATVTNNGVGEAKGVTVRLNDLPSGVSASQRSVSLGDLPPKSSQKVSISLRFDKRFGEGQSNVPISLSVADQRPIGKTATKNYGMEYHFNRPSLKVVDIQYFDGNDLDGQSEGNGNNQIEQDERILVRVRVANNGAKAAENVTVTMTSDKPSSHLIIQPSDQRLDALQPGEEKTVLFKMKVPNSVDAGPVAFTVTATEETFGTKVAEVNHKTIYEAGALTAAVNLAESGATKAKGQRAAVPAVENIDDVRSANYNRDAWALIIGIGQYGHSNIKSLKFAKSDATTMRDYLRNIGGVPDGNIRMLTDEQATSTGIRKGLGWLRDNAGGKSQVFIYYSGHGVPDAKHAPYLLPYDGEPQAIGDTGFAIATLKGEVNRFSTKRVMIALDACYTGDGRSESAEGKRGVAWADDDDTPTEAVVINASGEKEASWDYDDQRHGLFTYFFLKGMRGAAPDRNSDGMVDAEELYDYLKKEVPPVALRQRQAPQTPMKLGSGKGMIVSKRIE